MLPVDSTPCVVMLQTSNNHEQIKLLVSQDLQYGRAALVILQVNTYTRQLDMRDAKPQAYFDCDVTLACLR